MLREKQERIAMRVPESPSEGTIPGRSARSRLAAYFVWDFRIEKGVGS